MRKLLLILTVTSGLFQGSFAQDRVFTHTYQTNILPLGISELEYWNTLRSGREDYYNRIDQRLELELGLGHNVQTAFYLNFKTEAAYSGDVNAIVKDHGIGFSSEWKFKLSDPVANKLGSALYAEIGFDGDEVELEGKLILDKKIKDNLFALNLVNETEIKFVVQEGETGASTEIENAPELDLAYMHFVGKKKNNGIGFEIKNHNVITENDGWESSVWFAGPTLHFGGDRWFINFNIMPQLFNARKEEGSTENLELTEHEKVMTRFIVSFGL